MEEINLSKIVLKKKDKFIFDLLNIDFIDNPILPLRFYYNFIKKNINRIEGDILEFGVFKGRTLLATAILLKRLNSKKKVFGFDSFSGFSNNYLDEFDDLKYLKRDKNIYNKFLITKEIISKIRKTQNLNPLNISTNSNFAENNIQDLKKKIKILKLDNIVLIKGDFAKTVPLFFKKNFKVFAANIDCDLYKSYKIVLKNLSSRLSRGGYVHLDEYYSIKFPGAYTAVKDFIKNNINFKIMKNKTYKWEFNRYYLTRV
jgi:hypothetical protein